MQNSTSEMVASAAEALVPDASSSLGQRGAPSLPNELIVEILKLLLAQNLRGTIANFGCACRRFVSLADSVLLREISVEDVRVPVEQLVGLLEARKAFDLVRVLRLNLFPAQHIVVDFVLAPEDGQLRLLELCTNVEELHIDVFFFVGSSTRTRIWNAIGASRIRHLALPEAKNLFQDRQSRLSSRRPWKPWSSPTPMSRLKESEICFTHSQDAQISCRGLESWQIWEGKDQFSMLAQWS